MSADSQYRTDMEARVRHLEATVVRIEANTNELLALFRAGKTVATVFKWCVGVGASIAAIWAFVNTFHHKG